ncbi:hypothetical protein ElyMa_006577500 [Elysia marginata]|uniref:Ig-like domain-containing protein n=1 Tax=Elysia marginata TaxID=1093978 RepID=A0AAV4IGT4_9GAST|nr:hypothetical protein ElyMa_006577500 [Elysia marginata]
MPVKQKQNKADSFQYVLSTDIEIRSRQSSGGTGAAWEAHCTSGLDAQIEWHLDQAYVTLDDLVHSNVTEKFRTQNCANRESCRIRIIQVRNRSDNTFESTLSISPLLLSDFGYYYCQVVEHRSKQFRLELTGGKFLTYWVFEAVRITYNCSVCLTKAQTLLKV